MTADKFGEGREPTDQVDGSAQVGAGQDCSGTSHRRRKVVDRAEL